MASPVGIAPLGVAFGSTAATLAASASRLFDTAREGFLSGAIDWDTATIRVALVRSYTYNPAHMSVSDITAAGGVVHASSGPLTSKTVTGGSADAEDTSITPIADPGAHSLLVYQSSAVGGGADVATTAQRVIAWITGGSLPIVPGGGPVFIVWDNGPLKIFSIWRNVDAGSPVTAQPVGIAGQAALGVPFVIFDALVTPAAIPTGLVFGNPTANTGGGSAPNGWTLTTSNVGLAGVGLVGANLPLYTGSTTPASGTVITEMRIESTINLSNGNVTLRRCLIRPASIGQGVPVVTTSQDGTLTPPPTPVTIEDCDIDMSHLGDEPAGRATGFWGVANLRRNKIWGMGTGIAILQSGTQLSCEVVNNYCYDMRSVGDPATTGNHCSAFTIRGFAAPTGRTCLVKGNRFNLNTANASAAIFLQTYEGTIQNVTVDGNLLEGNGYNLVLEAYAGVTYTGMTANNNRFAPTGYGAGYTSGDTWDVFTENYMNDPLAVDNKGAFIGGL